MEGRMGFGAGATVVVVVGAWETIITGALTVVVVVVGTTSDTIKGTSGWLSQEWNRSMIMTSGRSHRILRIKT
jgi:hypothetical protein